MGKERDDTTTMDIKCYPIVGVVNLRDVLNSLRNQVNTLQVTVLEKLDEIAKGQSPTGLEAQISALQQEVHELRHELDIEKKNSP